MWGKKIAYVSNIHNWYKAQEYFDYYFWEITYHTTLRKPFTWANLIEFLVLETTKPWIKQLLYLEWMLKNGLSIEAKQVIYSGVFE